MNKPALRLHVVELLAGGWESQLLSLFEPKEIVKMREEGAALRQKLLRQQAAKKARGRRRPPVEEPDTQQSLV